MGEIVLKIATISPISRVNFIDTLSYFTSKNVSVGELVHITLRGRTVPGIVLGLEEIESGKLGIKASGYSLKKLVETSGKQLVPSWLVDVSRDIAKQTANSLPRSLSLLISKNHLFEEQEVSSSAIIANTEQTIDFVQDNFDSLLKKFESIVNSAKGRVVFICASDESVEQLGGTLNVNPVCFTSNTPRTKFLDQLQELNKNRRQVIAMTAKFSFLLNETVSDIILHEEELLRRGSPTYEIDLVSVMTHIAKKLGAKLTISSTLLSLESLQKLEISKLHFPTIHANVRDTNELLSEDIIELIGKSKQRSLIYIPRKGLAGHAVCVDCKTSVLCQICKSPMTLHNTDSQRTFVCHRCRRS